MGSGGRTRGSRWVVANPGAHLANAAVFDVNETMLDLAPVRAAIDGVFERSGAFATWFGRLLQTSMAVSAAGRYLDFSELARTALDSVAQTEARALPDDAWSRVAEAMGSLEAHPDVADGLGRLKAEGWTLVALTNSAQRSVDAQLAGAGIAPYFDHVLSVDSVRTYKPAPAPYRLAAETLTVRPSDLWMVACHDWDLGGAKAVGMSTAFVTRPGMPFSDAYPPADVTVTDFGGLADTLLPMP